ncbi:HrpB1 family type III secretion system apparatus protein [Paraburkholderia sp. 2C]|jgi:type III secretion protein HrpB1
MNVQKERLRCPAEAVGAVVELVRAAFAAGNTPPAVDTDDLEQAIDALHLMRPTCAEFAFFDGWLLMWREDWEAAEALFRDLVARSVCLPASKGMLLQCMKERDVFGWQDEARRLADEHAGDDVGRLAKTFLARDDLRHAVAAARRTGRFVAPESALALENADSNQDAGTLAASSQTACDLLATMQYMRI